MFVLSCQGRRGLLEPEIRDPARRPDSTIIADRKMRLVSRAQARPEYQDLLKLKEKYHYDFLNPNCDASSGQITEFVEKTWPNGDTYQGEWSNGERNGLGLSYWADKDQIYVGEYKNDKENGKGFWMGIVQWFVEMEETYIGDFVDGQSVGYGHSELESVPVKYGLHASTHSIAYYKGEFANNVPNGLGKSWQSDSDRSYIERLWIDMYPVFGSAFSVSGFRFRFPIQNRSV